MCTRHDKQGQKQDKLQRLQLAITIMQWTIKHSVYWTKESRGKLHFDLISSLASKRNRRDQVMSGGKERTDARIR